jgi:DeoR/GlpR family transcriptional regulator of sugar metabolism
MENSKERYLLLDHGKLKNEPKQYLGDFSEVDAVITDFVFEVKTLKKYEDTKFITV